MTHESSDLRIPLTDKEREQLDAIAGEDVQAWARDVLLHASRSQQAYASMRRGETVFGMKTSSAASLVLGTFLVTVVATVSAYFTYEVLEADREYQRSVRILQQASYESE